MTRRTITAVISRDTSVVTCDPLRFISTAAIHSWVSLVVECAELTILVRGKCRGVLHHTPVTAFLAVHLVVGTDVTPVFATQFASSITSSSVFAELSARRSLITLPSAMWLTSLPVQSEATTPSRGSATEAARVTVASTTSTEVI